TSSSSRLPLIRLSQHQPRATISWASIWASSNWRRLATTSDGEFLHHTSGPQHSHVNQVRARYSRFRQKLQKKGTKSAKRLMKKRSGREKRVAKDVNHCLSKAIVSTAKGTGRGLVLEDLTHIRSRVNGSKRQRRVLHSWGFFQLRAFIAYTAALAG